jgi:hypothetical protein
MSRAVDKNGQDLLSDLLKDQFNGQIKSKNMEQRLLDETKNAIQAEIKVVVNMISNMGDRIKGLCEQVRDIQTIHTRCTEATAIYRDKERSEIQDLKLTISNLAHEHVNYNEYETLKMEVAGLKSTIEAMRKWLYGIGTAAAVAIAREFFQTLFNK